MTLGSAAPPRDGERGALRGSGMRGGYILLAVVSFAVILMWLALRAPHEAAIERAREQTERQFAAVEAHLRALEVDYEFLASQGLALRLQEERDGIATALARLRSEQVELLGAAGVAPPVRVEGLSALAHEAEALAARADDLHARVGARRRFMVAATPLLQAARRLRDELAVQTPDDDALAARITELGGAFADVESQAALADRVLRTNVAQGEELAAQVLRRLEALIEQQELLQRRLEQP